MTTSDPEIQRLNLALTQARELGRIELVVQNGGPNSIKAGGCEYPAHLDYRELGDWLLENRK